MANITLHRTRTAGTVTKNAVDQEQSLEIVQILLHGSLSALSYLRNFFTEKVFENQEYILSESFCSYKDYSERTFRPDPASKEPISSTGMQILCRGRSQRVDELLDWLENGAFVALKAGNLRSLQVYVHKDPERRENVIETYTFNFKYAPSGPDGGQRVVGLEIGGPDSHPISIGTANGSLHELLRGLMKLCDELPNLPAKRYMSMALLYVHDTEEEDLPKGFVPNPSSSFFFAEAEGWEKRTEVLRPLQSGFHGASIQISHLQKQGFQFNPDVPGQLPPGFPRRLKFASTVRSFQGIDFTGLNAVDEGPTTPSTIVEAEEAEAMMAQDFESELPFLAPRTTSSDSVTTETSAIDPSRGVEPRSLTSFAGLIHATGSQHDDGLNTQSSDVPTMKRSFQNMMQPEYMTQGDTQTQWTPAVPQAEESETRSEVSLLTANRATSTGQATQPMLSQAVVKVLDSTKAKLRQNAVRLSKAEEAPKQSPELVLCQCGSVKEDSPMVMCVYCNTWQHLHCYGYTSVEDYRLPTNHVCYQCLLGGKEDERLKTLGELVLKRRGMYLAQQNGLKTQREFAADLDLKVPVARSIYNFLKQEEYVVPAGRGNGRAGKTQFVAVKEGSSHEKMLQNLFDPMMHISHHYGLPVQQDQKTKTIPRQPLVSQTGAMPPPTTPASRLPKKMATTPSTAGLDLRASMLPFETPSRAASLPFRSTKGQGEESLEGARPAKRQLTLATKEGHGSVASGHILDIGGISSPAPSTPTGSNFEI